MCCSTFYLTKVRTLAPQFYKSLLKTKQKKLHSFFHGLSWGVSHITFPGKNWGSPIPSQFEAGLKRPLLRIQMLWPSWAGPASPAASLPSQLPSSPREHRKETVLGARGAEGSQISFSYGWIPRGGGDRKSSGALAVRQRTSSRPLGPRALL